MFQKKSDGILTILTRVLRYWHIWMSCSVTFSLEVIEMDKLCMERQLLQLMNLGNGMRTMSNHKSSYRRSKSLACLLFQRSCPFFKTHVSVPIFQGIRFNFKKPGLVGQNQWLLRSKDPTAGIFHQVGSKHLCDPRPDHPHALARWGNSVFVKWLVFLNLGGKNNGTMVGWWCFFLWKNMMIRWVGESDFYTEIIISWLHLLTPWISLLSKGPFVVLSFWIHVSE